MDEGRVIAGVGRHEKMKDGEMSILFVYMLGWGGVYIMCGDKQQSGVEHLG